MKKQKIKIAIMSLSSLLMISLITSAVLANISAQFPDVDKSIIQMVLTIPALVGMVIALITGPLSSKVPKKSIIIFGLISALIGGIMGLVYGKTSIYILLFSSALIGIAQGINSTLTMSLIADYFEGDERSSLMGLQSAFVNGGSMVILLTSGMLAGIQWNYAYFVYLIILPVIAITVKNLPDDSPLKQQHTAVSNTSDKLGGEVYYICIVLLLFSTLSAVFQTNLSMFISSKQLGGASAVGLVNSVMTATGAVTGVFYGRLRKLFKNYVIPVSICATALGMLLVYFTGSLSFIFIAGILAGFSTSTIMPTVMFEVSAAVPPSKNATAIALANAASSIGMFVSPLIINPLVNSLGNGVEDIKFLISAIGLLILVALLVVLNINSNRKIQLQNPQPAYAERL